MKKLVYSLAALLALASCSEGFAISGTVDDRLQIPDGTVVTLLDNNGEVVAQIPVENGKFAYEMPVDVTTCYTLALNTDTYSEMVGFIPDNARAKVSFGPVSVAITGSTLSTEFNEIRSAVSELTEKAGEEFRRFYEVADEAGASEVEEKYNEDMKSVLSEAYSKNTDNYIGLATLKMLSEYLDYDEAVELYEKGGDIIRNDEDINEFIDRKKAAHDTSVGCKFVEITGKNVNFIEPFHIENDFGTFAGGHAGPNDHNDPEWQKNVVIARDVRFAKTSWKYAGAPFGWYRFSPGMKTVCGLYEQDGKYKMIVFQAESLAAEKTPQSKIKHLLATYSHTIFKPVVPVKELFEQILKIGATQHYAIVDGDCRAELKDFAEIMGFEYYDIR